MSTFSTRAKNSTFQGQGQTFDDARALLDKYNLWSKLPAALVRHLRERRDEHETAQAEELSHVYRYDVLLLKADAACYAAIEAARTRGFKPLLLFTLSEGDSGTLGRSFVDRTLQAILDIVTQTRIHHQFGWLALVFWPSALTSTARPTLGSRACHLGFSVVYQLALNSLGALTNTTSNPPYADV